MDETSDRVIRAAVEFIVENIKEPEYPVSEGERAIIERDVAGTLAWLVTRWRSEGGEIERLGKTLIAATVETVAHLEDLVKMDEEDI